jgi:hypothetical protein
MHDCSNHRSLMTHFRHSKNIINIQKPKFLYCLVGLNERSPEIVFSGHQNAENEQKETLN